MPYQTCRLDLMLLHSKYRILASVVSEIGKVGKEKGGSVAVSIWPQILPPAVVTSRCAQSRRYINHHAFFSSSLSLQHFSSQTSWFRSLCILQPSMDFSWTNASTPLEAIQAFDIFNILFHRLTKYFLKNILLLVVLSCHFLDPLVSIVPARPSDCSCSLIFVCRTEVYPNHFPAVSQRWWGCCLP